MNQFIPLIAFNDIKKDDPIGSLPPFMGNGYLVAYPINVIGYAKSDFHEGDTILPREIRWTTDNDYDFLILLKDVE